MRLGLGLGISALTLMQRAGAVGGAVLLAGEVEGFGADALFPDTTRAGYVKRVDKTPTLDDYLTNASTSPKYLPDATGVTAWTAHNLAVQSEDLTASPWSNVGSPVVTATTVEDDNAGSIEARRQTFTVIVDRRHTASVLIAKDAITSRFPQVDLFASGGANMIKTQINTSTGAKADVSAVNGSSVVTDEGANWRVSLTVVPDTTTLRLDLYGALGVVFGVESVAAVGITTFTKIQVNRGPVPTAYLRTTTSARFSVPIEFSPTSIGTRLGMRSEPAATNLVLHNRNLPDAAWTKANATALKDAVGVDGVANSASTLTINVSGAANGFSTAADIPVVASTVYIFSFYAKAGTATGLKYAIRDQTNAAFIVSDVDYTPGAGAFERITVTFTTPVGCITVKLYPVRAPTGTGTVIFDLVQLELGPVATSPIPTFATAITRSADFVTFPLSATPSVQDAGTALMDFTRISIPVVSARLLQLDDGTVGERITVLWSADGRPRTQVSDNSVTVVDISGVGAVVSDGVRAKLAVAWELNNSNIAWDGVAQTTDTVCTLPTTTVFRFGHNQVNLNNDHTLYHKLALVPRRATDAKLQTNTASDTFAVLQAAETQGLFIDFTSATPITVKWVSAFHDPAQFFAWPGGSPKLTPQLDGVLWSPHNLFINSEFPATQNVTLATGQTYTISVVGSGSITGSVGASGVATAGSPATFVATGTSGTFTLAGSLTRIQLNVGSSAARYIRTTTVALFGLADEYDPVTPFAKRGWLWEPAAIGLALWNRDLTNAAWTKSNLTLAKTATGPDGVANSASTLTATAGNATALQAITSGSAARITSMHVKRRTGTGVVEMTQDNGTTWTPVTVTSLWSRVEIPVATAANPTVGIRIVTSGDEIDVDLFQHEVGSVVSSPIPTFDTAVTRAQDNPFVLLSAIPALGSAYAMYVKGQVAALDATTKNYFALSDGTANEYAAFRGVSGVKSLSVVDGGVAQTAPLASVQTILANVDFQSSARVKANDFAISVNGEAVVKDTVGTLPSPDRMTIGSLFGTTNPMTSPLRIKKIVVVPRDVLDAELPTWRYAA